MTVVRAKFKVDAINPGNITDGVGKSITLSPVTTGSKENEEFYRWTPGGNILLSTVNETAAAQFEVGKEFYVDFIAAE